uniref:Uncharacterized protein n=1 Tax=Cryptomonas curvata TaxID=233186 RepID=A0A7S0MFQ1_9CRYP
MFGEVPFQTIVTVGAVNWESFEIDSVTYLAVANYYDGTSFQLNSTVYQISRENPDLPTPRVDFVQHIPTLGATDVLFFASEESSFLLFTNRWGGNVTVYRWINKNTAFVFHQVINSYAPMKMQSFSLDKKIFVAIACLSTENKAVSDSSVYVYNPATKLLDFSQSLVANGSIEIQFFYVRGQGFLLLTSIDNEDINSISKKILFYKWDGTYFVLFHVLPTREANSPIILQNSESAPAFVALFSGRGTSSVVYQLLAKLNSTLRATHVKALEFDMPVENVLVNQTRLPSISVQVMNLNVPWHQDMAKLSAAAAIYVNVVPDKGDLYGGFVEEAVISQNTMLPNNLGLATFSDIKLIRSGMLKLKFSNHYLNDVYTSNTQSFYVSSSAAIRLIVRDFPPLVRSGHPFNCTVLALDEFENVDSSFEQEVISNVLHACTMLPSNLSSAAVLGITQFVDVMIHGSGSGHMVFETASLRSAIITFGVQANAWIWPMTNVSTLVGASAVTVASDLLLFGGQSNLVAVNTVIRMSISEFSSLSFPVAAEGLQPSPRYDHAAVTFVMDGVHFMIVFGGRNETQPLDGIYLFDIDAHIWSRNPIEFSPRFKHRAVTGNLDSDSIIFVFGGINSTWHRIAELQIFLLGNDGIEQKEFVSDYANSPPPLSEFIMSWHDDRGYIIGSDNISSFVHSFSISKNATGHILVIWKKTDSIVSGGLWPEFFFGQTGFSFNCVIHVLAKSKNDFGISLYGFDPASSEWFKGYIIGTIPRAEQITVSAVGTANAVIFSPNELSLGPELNRAGLLSFAPGIRLNLLAPLGGAAIIGVVIANQPIVQVLDVFNAPATFQATQIIVRAQGSDNYGEYVALGGTTYARVVDGIASFTDLSINGNASWPGVFIKFFGIGLFSSYSNYFSMSIGPAAQLKFSIFPMGIFNGQPFIIQPVIEVVDWAGNVILNDFSSSVTAEIFQVTKGSDGKHITTASLLGNITATVKSGRALFTDLRLEGLGPFYGNYNLTVSRIGLFSATFNDLVYTNASQVELRFCSFKSSADLSTDLDWYPETAPCGQTTCLNNISSADSRFASSPFIFAGLPFLVQPTICVHLIGDSSTNSINYSNTSISIRSFLVLNESRMFGPNCSDHDFFAKNLTGNPVSFFSSSGTAKFTDMKLHHGYNSTYVIKFSACISDHESYDETSSVNGSTKSFNLPVPLRTLTSQPFKIVSGYPAFISFISGPTVEKAGSVFLVQPSVQLLDYGKNPAKQDGIIVTANLLQQDNLIPAAYISVPLSGQNHMKTTIQGGNVYFTDLKVAEPGNDYIFNFTLQDKCCNLSVSTLSHPFNVTAGSASLLFEIRRPEGAVASLPFQLQPTVNVMDMGGRLVKDGEDRLVTAVLNVQDGSLDDIFSQSPAWVNLGIPNVVLRNIEMFEANDEVYLIASMSNRNIVPNNLYSMQNSTYSQLFRMPYPAGPLIPLQTLGFGRQSFWKHVLINESVYLIQANTFDVLRNSSSGLDSDEGIITRYSTNSTVYEFVNQSLVLRSRFATSGAVRIEVFQAVCCTYISISNSRNDEASSFVNHAVYVMNNSILLPVLNPVISDSAVDWTRFQADGVEFWAVAERFEVTVYARTDNVLLSFQKLPIIGIVRLHSFCVQNRTFLAVANSVLGNSSIIIYEFTRSQLNLFQVIATSFWNLTDLDFFQAHGNIWLVAACFVNRNSSAIILYNSSLRHCPSDSCARFDETRRWNDFLDSKRVLFFTGKKAQLLLIQTEGGFFYLDFQRMTINGHSVVQSKAGVVNFTDLSVDKAGEAYSLTFTSGQLMAVGGFFNVLPGALSQLVVLVNISDGAGGEAFSVQPTLGLADVAGNIVVMHPQYVISASSLSASLVGDQEVPVMAGIASFTDLGVKQIGQNEMIFTAKPLLQCWNVSSNFQVSDFNKSKIFQIKTFVRVSAGRARIVILDQQLRPNTTGGSFLQPARLHAVDAGGNRVQSNSAQSVSAILSTDVALKLAVIYSWNGSPFSRVLSVCAFVSHGNVMVAIATESTSSLYQWQCSNQLALRFDFPRGTTSFHKGCSEDACFLAVVNPRNASEIYLISPSGSVEPSPLLSSEISGATSWEIFQMGATSFFALNHQQGLRIFSFQNDSVKACHDIYLVNTSSAKHFRHSNLNFLLVLQHSQPFEKILVFVWNGSSFLPVTDFVLPSKPKTLNSFEVLYSGSSEPVIAISADDGPFELYSLNLSQSECDKPAAINVSFILLQPLTYNVSRFWMFSFGRATWILTVHNTNSELFQCKHSNPRLVGCQFYERYNSSLATISFVRSSGKGYIFAGNVSAMMLFELQAAGSLDGTIVQRIQNGTAIFSDLIINRQGADYSLGFALTETLENDDGFSEGGITYTSIFYVGTGPPSLVTLDQVCLECCSGESFSASVLDAGGNLVSEDNDTVINVAFDSVDNVDFVHSFSFHVQGARSLKYLELGNDGEYVVVGLFFNGSRFNLESPVLKLNVPDPLQFEYPNSDLYARYTVSSWNDSLSVWHDVSGNQRDSTMVNGKSNVSMGNDFSARANIAWLSGSSVDSINFTELPKIFTICSVSRYSNTVNQKQILVGSGNSAFFHGHHNGMVGIIKYGNLAGNSSSILGNISSSDWVVICGQNAGSKYALINGVPIELTTVDNRTIKNSTEDDNTTVGNMTVDSSTRTTLGINTFPSYASDWAVMEIAVWSRALSLDELKNVSVYYLSVLGIFEEPFKIHQKLKTKGAYYFDKFAVQSGLKQDYFLAVANHYDDTFGFATNSEIYKWDNVTKQFAIFQQFPTFGATSVTAFQIENSWNIAITNYFDGTSHAVDSVIYRWSTISSKFEEYQHLNTVGAHHLAYFSYGGRQYLVVAQYGIDKIGDALSSVSLVYLLDQESGFFTVLMPLDTKGAVHIETFFIGQELFIAVANSVDPYNGHTKISSKIFTMRCLRGEDLVVEFQSIDTIRATQWKHFRRAGRDYLALTNYVPENSQNDSFTLYIWDGCSFWESKRYLSEGAHGLDHAIVAGRHYIFEARPSASEVLVRGAGGTAAPFVAHAKTSGGKSLFSSPALLSDWAVDISSDGLLYIGDKFGCGIQMCNRSLG